MRRVTTKKLVELLSYPIDQVVAARKLRVYEPKRGTIRGIREWAKQFPREHRRVLVRLSRNLEVIAKEAAIRNLVRHNDAVLARLDQAGIGMERIIYITTDKPASSSHIMLGLLRDEANLERRGAHLIDVADIVGIQKKTRELERGAIIYVDDFAGTGKQFMRSRRRVAEHVVGAFSEFFIALCVCEEAVAKSEREGIEVCTSVVHRKEDRPLHAKGTFLGPNARRDVVELGEKMWKGRSLGFDKLATNVIVYRAAPNTTPLIFRGNLGQSPYRGIVPRFDDLGRGTEK